MYDSQGFVNELPDFPGPVEFQHSMLSRQLWGRQQEIVNAIEKYPKIAVKGCHGSGKTFAVAGTVPWWLLKYPDGKVITIAPTLRQVKNFWNEISLACTQPACKIKFPEMTTTGLTLAKDNYATGFSSNRGVNAQGFHGGHVLILVDEAIGVESDLWDAIEGIRSAGHVTIVSLCNPTVPSGVVFEDFTKNRKQTHCITISAFDTPNFDGVTLERLIEMPEEELDVVVNHPLIRRRWAREMYHKWGPNNPRFQSRVLGEFPEQSDYSVFNLAWIEKAALPYEPDQLAPWFKAGMIIQVGVDVAGAGDDETCAYARIGPFILKMEAWSDPDPRGKVLLFFSEIKRAFPGASIIVVVDTVGVGYYMAKHIADSKYAVFSFIAGGKPIDPLLYENVKAEAYWRLREIMKIGQLHGLEDEDTKAQLSDVQYHETPMGQIEIESKKDARKRGSVSPDRAEALVMAFAIPSGPRNETVVSETRKQISVY